MISEFKKFISRGNVLDLAVGVIMGSAFTAIVTSFVNNLINPILGLIIGQIDLSDMVWKVADAKIKYGAFLNAIINFLIVAFVLFLMIKLINRFLPQKEEKVEKGPTTNDYLAEIRDLLKEK